jgi:hypothetical protein
MGYYKMQVRTVMFLLMAGLLFFLGCDSPKDATHSDKETSQIYFVESSKGLPVVGQWRQDISIADVDGDGFADIVGPPPRKGDEGQKRPFIWSNKGGAEWTEAIIRVPQDVPYKYGGIAVSDFDGDGIADIALAIHAGGIRVLKGKGKLEYEDLSDGLPSSEDFMSRAVISVDMNNDGVFEIAALSEGLGSGVWIFSRSNNAWAITPVGIREERKGLFGDHLAAGDVNGDGKIDIVAASLDDSTNRIVWINDGKGGFSPFNRGLPEGLHYIAVDLADLNGDRRDDLLVSIAGVGKGVMKGLRAFLSTPDGFTDISQGLPVDVIFTCLRACDLDKDGRAEIIGGTGRGGVRIFSQEGNGWREAAATGLPEKGLEQIYNAHCADLNNDGFKDIVINHAKEQGNSGGIRVFLNVAKKP